MSIQKKEEIKKIKKIDNILNDKTLLQEEYIKRNEKRRQHNKIFSISHLEEILNKERKRSILKIEENNKLIEPKYYVKIIAKIEEDLELLKDIDLETNVQEANKLKYILELQKLFMKCFYKKIETSTTKDEIINLLYMLRYYNLMYITQKHQIKDVLELKSEREQIVEALIKKAYEMKALNTITNEKEVNNKIVKNILNTKIICLENINIELKENLEGLEINIYDGEIFEKTITIREYNKRKIIAKFGKKIRVFN